MNPRILILYCVVRLIVVVYLKKKKKTYPPIHKHTHIHGAVAGKCVCVCVCVCVHVFVRAYFALCVIVCACVWFARALSSSCMWRDGRRNLPRTTNCGTTGRAILNTTVHTPPHHLTSYPHTNPAKGVCVLSSQFYVYVYCICMCMCLRRRLIVDKLGEIGQELEHTVSNIVCVRYMDLPSLSLSLSLSPYPIYLCILYTYAYTHT